MGKTIQAQAPLAGLGFHILMTSYIRMTRSHALFHMFVLNRGWHCMQEQLQSGFTPLRCARSQLGSWLPCWNSVKQNNPRLGKQRVCSLTAQGARHGKPAITNRALPLQGKGSRKEQCMQGDRHAYPAGPPQVSEPILSPQVSHLAHLSHSPSSEKPTPIPQSTS